MFYLYKINNIINNKIYIGQTNDPIQRWSQYRSAAKHQHNKTVITRAMIKYGVDNFKFDVIMTAKTLEDINILEQECIRQYDSRNSLKGYNVDYGGGMETRSPETIKKIKAGLKKFYANNPSPMIGFKHTEESRRKMSLSSMGKAGTNTGKEFDEEWCLKIGKSNAGMEKKSLRRFSEEVEKEICRLYVEEELSIYKLGHQFNASRSLIISILDRNDIVRRKNNYTGHFNGRNIFNKEEEQAICEEYLLGKSTIKDLSIKYKCGRTTLRDILLRNKTKL